MEEETECGKCGGACRWERNIETCTVCGVVSLHFEGDLPDIVEALDFVLPD